MKYCCDGVDVDQEEMSWVKSIAEPLSVAPPGCVLIFHVLPAQSVRAELPDPTSVELICSRMDVASIDCVLSILLRLFVAIASIIKVSMLMEPMMRIAAAINVPIIVMPDCEFLRW